jgi:hypothetical protein
MLVRDLAMEVYRIINGGDVSDDSGLDLIDYMEEVQQVAAKKIQETFFINYKSCGEAYIDENYIEVYENNEILYNEVQDVYYIKVPAPILMLPKGYGIQYIGLSQSLDSPFARLTIGNQGIYANIPSDITSYIATQERIQFSNLPYGVKNLVVALVPAKPTNISEDDASDIKNEVVKRMLISKGIIQDKVNNSNPTPTNNGQ